MKPKYRELKTYEGKLEVYRNIRGNVDLCLKDAVGDEKSSIQLSKTGIKELIRILEETIEN